MKKVILTLALFTQLTNLAKADTAITINVSSLMSGANLEVVIYALDINTHQPVGQTTPIAVSASSGNVIIDIENIEWDGVAPTENWGWGYAEIKVACSVPTTTATPILCGSLNIDGVTIGIEPYQSTNCFEVSTTDCSTGQGDNIEAEMTNGNGGNMGNSGNGGGGSYPTVIDIR